MWIHIMINFNPLRVTFNSQSWNFSSAEEKQKHGKLENNMNGNGQINKSKIIIKQIITNCDKCEMQMKNMKRNYLIGTHHYGWTDNSRMWTKLRGRILYWYWCDERRIQLIWKSSIGTISRINKNHLLEQPLSFWWN